MHWARFVQYAASLLPLLFLLLGYGTIFRRNGGRFGDYARRLAEEHCLHRLEPSERVLIVSQTRYAMLPQLLGAAIIFPYYFLQLPPSVLNVFMTLLCGSALFFFNLIHMQAVMSAVVVTAKAIHWCDGFALPPDIRTKTLTANMEVFFTPWSRDLTLMVDREHLGRLDFANCRQIHRAILDAIAALGAQAASEHPPT